MTMEVNINEIASTVRVVDGNGLLSPQVMEKIVRTVLQALREQEEHRARVRSEQKITRGVRYEEEEGWR
jgi:hypothetical protein